jgi:hypothetical protein
MRTGRRRKPGVRRDSSGKSRGEPHIVHPETIAIRQRDLARDGISADDALNALAGFTLGRLYLRHQKNPQDPGAISREQYEAGEAWTKIVHRHAALMGYSLTTRSQSFIMVGGTNCAPEPLREEVERVRGKWRECYEALLKALPGEGLAIQRVCYGVCIENWNVGQLSEVDYGHLRAGLNALVRVMG